MFGEVAVGLLKLMGQSGVLPGAILAADIPAAVQRLRSAVDKQPAEKGDDAKEDGEPRSEPYSR
jgi:hypothetical protein